MLRWLLTWFIFLGSLAWLLLLAFVRLGETRRPWPIELLDTFAPYAFVPFLGLALLALAPRSRILLLPLLGAGLLFWHQFGQYFAPGPVLAASDAPTVRVLTYNVLWRNGDAGPLAELVRAERPDVIALQELTGPYAADLRQRLGEAYPYVALADVERRNSGSGVYSRLPILKAREFELSAGGHATQHVRLGIGAGAVSLFNVHLDSPDLALTNPPGPIPLLVRGFGSPHRDQELERLIDRTTRLREPYILAGDFNLAAGSRPYREFPDGWRDAFGERGWGFGHTFPTRYPTWPRGLSIPIPLVRIDYVLSSPDLAPSRAWVAEVAGSDHLPVIADLRLAGTR